jgi:hypothetical protein
MLDIGNLAQYVCKLSQEQGYLDAGLNIEQFYSQLVYDNIIVNPEYREFSDKTDPYLFQNLITENIPERYGFCVTSYGNQV